jgi:hypothetical protein
MRQFPFERHAITLALRAVVIDFLSSLAGTLSGDQRLGFARTAVAGDHAIADQAHGGQLSRSMKGWTHV